MATKITKTVTFFDTFKIFLYLFRNEYDDDDDWF